MAQKKLVRFAELNTFPNVWQYPADMAGKWHQHFANTNDIVLELACGKGEYTVGLAQLYANKNFIGVDVKGNRIWVGAKKALQQGLQQVAFVRAQIDGLNSFFSNNEIAEIWITFPDPQLRFSKAKKRLTHPVFLRRYQQIIQPGGKIHLKTDSPHLYRFTKEVLAMYQCTIIVDMDDVYKHKNISQELQIKTHYEALDIAQSHRIHYLCFTLPPQLAGEEKDAVLKESIRYELQER